MQFLRQPARSCQIIVLAIAALICSGCPMPGDMPAARRAKKKAAQKLEQIQSECIQISRLTIGGYPMLGDTTAMDVDNDDRVELLVRGQSALHLIDLEGKQVDRVKWETELGSIVKSVEPVMVGGKTQWVVIHEDFEREGNAMVDRPVATLLSRSGKKLWEYRPALPKKESGEIAVASGRLRSRDQAEIVLAINMQPSFDLDDAKNGTDRILSAMENRHGHIVVLNAVDGGLLCQLPVSGNIEFIRIVANDEPGDLDRLVFGVGNEILFATLRFPAASHPSTPSTSGQQSDSER